MTVYTEKPVAQASGTLSPAVSRLRMREVTLRQQAARLQARAEHLQRVGRVKEQRLMRRVDAHEKIVLGAMVKKARLDLLLHHISDRTEQRRNDKDTMPTSREIANQSSDYDRDLILGSLMWLAVVLTLSRDLECAQLLPDRNQLREAGHRALHSGRRGHDHRHN